MPGGVMMTGQRSLVSETVLLSAESEVQGVATYLIEQELRASPG
jgi:hypothetical protein